MREVAGGQPLSLGTIKQRGGRAKKITKRVMKSLGGPKSHHEFEPYDDDDPIVKLFEQPNEYDVQYDLWAYTILFYLLTGEAYWWVMRDVNGMPKEIWVIPTHWVRLVNTNDGNPSHYWVQSPWGASTNVPFDEVVVFRQHSPLNRFEGTAVSQAVAEWIDAYESSVRARLAQYKNGAIPSFHVALGDTFGDPDEAFLARFYSKWFMRFQGENRTNLPLITGPDVDVKALGISPVDMNYIANEDQFRDMTLAAYGVPKAIVGLEPTSDTCHDAETECLTANGWLRHEQITLDTRVACYDPDSNRIVYRRPTAIIRQEYEGPMHRWKGQVAGMDALMTPNHKVWVSRQGRRGRLPWRKEKVGHFADVPTVSLRTKQAALAACSMPAIIEIEPSKFGTSNRGPKSSRTESYHIDPMAWMDFLGWFVSEGSTTIRVDKHGITRGSGCLCQQADSEWVEDIDACMARLGIHFTKTLSVSRNTLFWHFYDPGLIRHLREHCGKHAHEKHVPAYVKDWPGEYLQTLLKSLVSGDGSRYSKKAWALFTSSKQLADDVQELATKSGWRSSIVARSTPTRMLEGRELPVHNGYRVNLLVGQEERIVQGIHRSVENYKGIVWCLEVPTGLFVTRRNGCTLISSNSAYAPLRQFLRFSVNPVLMYFGQIITTKMIRKTPGREHGVGYWDERVIDDPERKLKEIESRAQRGTITPNEERALWGAEPFPHGGDDPLVNGVPVDWVSGKKPDETHEIDQAFQRALSGVNGSSGGYTEKNGRAVLNGRH